MSPFLGIDVPWCSQVDTTLMEQSDHIAMAASSCDKCRCGAILISSSHVSAVVAEQLYK